jgi:hypothetical protein
VPALRRQLEASVEEGKLMSEFMVSCLEPGMFVTVQHTPSDASEEALQAYQVLSTERTHKVVETWKTQLQEEDYDPRDMKVNVQPFQKWTGTMSACQADAESLDVF